MASKRKISKRIRALNRLIAGNAETLEGYRQEVKDLKQERYQIRYKRRLAKRKFLMGKLLPFVFRLYAKRPLDEKKVLLVYDRTETLPDNLAMVRAELERRNAGFKIINYLQQKRSRISVIKQMQNVLYYIKFTKDYATAAHIIMVEYFIPIYANKPREGSQVIQLWHGCGAFKKWGWATLDSSWGIDRYTNSLYPVHVNYSHVSVSSASVIPNYAEAFNMPEEQIDAYGMPRTDVFFDQAYKKNARKLFDKLFPQLRGRKIVLYAPTFRGNSVRRSFNKNRLYLPYLEYFLKEEYVLVYKLHPLVANAFEIPEQYADFAVDVSKTMEINQILQLADILISDYSSLIFEYALLERPMIFYAYDLEKYTNNRDFFYDYREMVPGRIVSTNYELVDAIKNAYRDFDPERMRAFKEYFMSACDGHSTERIVDKYIMNRQ